MSAPAVHDAGVGRYVAEWLGPWRLTYMDQVEADAQRSALTTVVFSSEHMRKDPPAAYCCPDLHAGAVLRCPAGVQVRVAERVRHSQARWPEGVPVGPGPNILLINHESHAHVTDRPPSAYERRRSAQRYDGAVTEFHIISTMEPPNYNSAVRIGNGAHMQKYDFALTFSARHPGHIVTPYLMMREVEHVFAPLRVPFVERRVRCTHDQSVECSIAALVSNCRKMTFHRARVLQRLVADGRLDSFGNCHHNTGPSRITSIQQEDELLSRYKIMIALENSVCEDYITEKLARAYRLQLVPVVFDIHERGVWMPGYARQFPLTSYINAAAFSSVDALIAHLHAVSTNETLWTSYMQHRTRNDTAVRAWSRRRFRIQGLPLCKLAQAALDRWQSTGKGRGAHVLQPVRCADSNSLAKFTES